MQSNCAIRQPNATCEGECLEVMPKGHTSQPRATGLVHGSVRHEKIPRKKRARSDQWAHTNQGGICVYV